MDDELAALAPWCADAVVVGVSGGATMGLAMAAAGVPFTAAFLHEPAVGSLLPGLLDAVVAAYAAGGAAAFGAALYGPAWTPSELAGTSTDAGTGTDADRVARDIAMFRRFEPAAPA